MRLFFALAALVVLAFPMSTYATDEEHHSHPAPERLGTVSFQTSCRTAVQPAFERAMALLHSFAYDAAASAFADVAAQDPDCAMAHWGIAMSHFHELWEPPGGDELRMGSAEIQTAKQIGAATLRERQFVDALSEYYCDAERVPPAIRAQAYAHAMADVARNNPRDIEAQIFYALALIATASPSDQTHRNQKQAADILGPIFQRLPQHPGAAHYLIHACDSAELAARGLAAARAYSKIAPSAPHALHMPSHIFTRLGLWDDSIASNLAARAAAHAQGDLGEELHAMDYLTYAYLQRGRYTDAEGIVADLGSMKVLAAAQFKIGYAATAMPIRLGVERHDWLSAAAATPVPQAPPQVVALTYWARALGRSRAEHRQSSDLDIAKLQACLSELKSAGNSYWTTQVDVLVKEAEGWRARAAGEAERALAGLRAAADEEDAIEKLPVTPGPIIPAREQLGELLLALQRPDQALREFRAALALAPRRRGAVSGAIEAAERLGDEQTAARLRALLSD